MPGGPKNEIEVAFRGQPRPALVSESAVKY
jgi:hypothetical protein